MIDAEKFKKYQVKELGHSKKYKDNKILPDGKIHEWARETFPYPDDGEIVLEVCAGLYGCLREDHYSNTIGLDPLMSKFTFRAWKVCITAVGEYIPFRDNTFDYVYCVDGLDHGWKPAMALNEMYRVLKKGGKLFFYTDCTKNDIYHHPVNYEELLLIFNKMFSNHTVIYNKSPIRRTKALYGVAVK